MDEVDVEVIRDEQVKQAVAIALDKRASGGVADAWLQEPGFLRDVGEGAVAVVVIERALVHARHEDVRVAVVIVIAHGNACVESAARQTGGIGDIGEDAVSVVTKEPVPIFRRVLCQRGEVGAVGEKDVGPAIAVVIENGHPAGHRLRSVARQRLIALKLEINRLIRKSDGRGGGRPGAEEKDQSRQQHQAREETSSLDHEKEGWH